MFGSRAPPPAPEGPNENTSLTGKGPKDLDGRRCTDVICLLLFVVYWVVMLGLGGYVYVAGDAHGRASSSGRQHAASHAPPQS